MRNTGASAKTTIKTIRFTEIEAELLEQSARSHGVSVSDVVREAVILWRERVGDRAAALEAWSRKLLTRYGDRAVLSVRLREDLSLDVEIDGAAADQFVAEAVFDNASQVQIWVGDPDSDARAYIGRVPAVARASIAVPLCAVPSLGASDASAV